MSDQDTITTLMAARSYLEAVPLLRAAVESNADDVKLRLQLADALAGSGSFEESLDQYGRAESHYQAAGLFVQTMGIKKKIEKVRDAMENAVATSPPAPHFESPPKKNPLLAELSEDSRNALLAAMDLEEHDEGDVIISEGDEGCSMFIIVSGSVKVYTRNPKGENVYLAKLGENDYFGEISLLTGKIRTATIAASARTELLRLDKASFDGLMEDHPRVREILDEFCQQRANETVEAMIDSLRGKK